MVDQIKKPGVEIKQSFTTTPSPAVIPTLAPCVVGPAFEVVDLVDDNGSPSVESKVQVTTGDLQYRQVPATINVGDYPAPRADKTQMSVLADEVDVALARSGAFDVRMFAGVALFMAVPFLRDLPVRSAHWLGDRAGPQPPRSGLGTSGGGNGNSIASSALLYHRRGGRQQDFYPSQEGGFLPPRCGGQK